MAKEIYYALLEEENVKRNISEIEDILDNSDFDGIEKSSENSDQEHEEGEEEHEESDKHSSVEVKSKPF